MASNRISLARSVVIVAIAFLAAVAHGRLVAIARPVPAKDAIAAAEAWIKGHPKEGEGFRTLGRIQALAWGYGENIPLVGSPPNALPQFSEDSTVLVSRRGPGVTMWDGKDTFKSEDRNERPVTADDAANLAASIAAYRKAIELDPNDALSELGLAWMLAQQGLYARELPLDYWGDLKPTEAEKLAWSKAIGQLASEDFNDRDAASKVLMAAMPKCVLVLRDAKVEDPESVARIDAVLRDSFQLQALDHYRRAFQLRATEDLKGDPNYDADSQISAKAGTQILAVISQHPEAAKKGESKSVQEVLDPLAKKLRTRMMGPQ